MKLCREAMILVKNGLTSAIANAECHAKEASKLVKDNPSKLNDPAIEYFGEQEKQYFEIAKEICKFRDSVK